MLEPSTCTKSVAQCELLVVDDQQAQLKSLQQLLHISGYTNVTLASGGDEAIRILQNNPPQLILLDLLMPGTNGLEVIAFHHQAGLDSEIIVISGETSFPWVKDDGLVVGGMASEKTIVEFFVYRCCRLMNNQRFFLVTSRWAAFGLSLPQTRRK